MIRLKNACDRKMARASRDEHGLGLDRTGSGLKSILAGWGVDRTAISFKIGGSGLDRTEIIKYQKFLL